MRDEVSCLKANMGASDTQNNRGNAPSGSPTALYRHYDADGQLLYVGISNNPLYRLHQHETSGWFFDIANVSIEWHCSECSARAAEQRAIASERPTHNKAHNATGRVGAFVSAVGRKQFAQRMGLSAQAVSAAITNDRMPCKWARTVASICREYHLYLPIDAFPFKGVSENKNCITTLFAAMSPSRPEVAA